MTMLVDKTLQDNIDINNNDVSISGNLQFDTSYDLNEFNILKNYKYGFQIDASVLKKIFKLNKFSGFFKCITNKFFFIDIRDKLFLYAREFFA